MPERGVSRGPFVPPAGEERRCIEEPPEQELPEGLAWAVEARMDLHFGMSFDPRREEAWLWPHPESSGDWAPWSQLVWHVQPVDGPLWTMVSGVTPPDDAAMVAASRPSDDDRCFHHAVGPRTEDCGRFVGVREDGDELVWTFEETLVVHHRHGRGDSTLTTLHEVTTDAACAPLRELSTTRGEDGGVQGILETRFSLPGRYRSEVAPGRARPLSDEGGAP